LVERVDGPRVNWMSRSGRCGSGFEGDVGEGFDVYVCRRTMRTMVVRNMAGSDQMAFIHFAGLAGE